MIYCSNKVEVVEPAKVLMCNHSIHETCGNCIEKKKKDEELKKKEAFDKMKPEEKKNWKKKKK